MSSYFTCFFYRSVYVHHLCTNSSVPTSETELSFSIGELEFSELNFNKKYVPENIEQDEPFEPVPVRVKVMYAKPKTPIYKG